MATIVPVATAVHHQILKEPASALGSISTMENTDDTTAKADGISTTEKKADETWEIVTDDKPAVRFEVEAVHIPDSNRKVLKHCQSSPNLSSYHGVFEEDEDGIEELSLSESVVVVDKPAAAASKWGGPISFRDAILAQSDHGSRQPDVHDAQDMANIAARSQQQSAVKPATRKVKPNFVVVPIKRCAKSTGDLLSLARDHDHEDEDVMGDTDAHEFYSRKAHGSRTYGQGLKTRPDEAKRLQMTMAKKNMQRQRQAAGR